MHMVDTQGGSQVSTRKGQQSDRPVRVIAVTGGKGGVGKTNVSVNLAMAMAESGKKVILMDADLGLANVDVLLGLHPKHTLRDVIRGTHTLDEVMVEGPNGMLVIPASSGLQDMVHLTPVQHAGLIRAFSSIEADVDVLIVDTAAGISDGVISFCRAAQEVVMVVHDEPASITDAYAQIKLLNREHGLFRFHILPNMAESAQEGRDVYEKIAKVTDRFLDVALDYMGYVPYDEYLVKSVRKQRAVVEAFPRSRSALAFKNLAEKAQKWPLPSAAGGHLEFFVERLIQGNQPKAEVLP